MRYHCADNGFLDLAVVQINADVVANFILALGPFIGWHGQGNVCPLAGVVQVLPFIQLAAKSANRRSEFFEAACSTCSPPLGGLSGLRDGVGGHPKNCDVPSHRPTNGSFQGDARLVLLQAVDRKAESPRNGTRRNRIGEERETFGGVNHRGSAVPFTSQRRLPFHRQGLLPMSSDVSCRLSLPSSSISNCLLSFLPDTQDNLD